MFRHFPGRNQRSKSNKTKLGLCCLVAVCLWLMYQVKHSYDKKKEFDAQSGLTIKIATDNTKLGRKDLKPKMKETVTTNEEVNEELDDDETAAEEEKKKLEDEEEQDLKSEKKYDAKVDREEDLMEDEENIGLDTKGRVRHANTTGPLEIEEYWAHQNAISGIEKKDEIENTGLVNDDAVDDGATFGDVTGLRTNFLNQTMDTDDKTAMIEDGPSKTKIADEIQQDHKGLF